MYNQDRQKTQKKTKRQNLQNLFWIILILFNNTVLLADAQTRLYNNSDMAQLDMSITFSLNLMALDT